MKLSETRRARDWLQQFEVDDRSAATALLDAVRFAPGGDVVSGVRNSVELFISQDRHRTPVALVPIISGEDMRPLQSAEPGHRLTVFKDFDPAQLLENEPGSEALMAHLIREVRRATSKELLVPAPLSLDRLRAGRVRTLLCLTDYIGSGQQVLDYVEAWCRHPTIRSWRSFGWLEIVVVAYAATAVGMRAVESSRFVDALEVTEIAPGLDELRKLSKAAKVEEICRVYARRGKLSSPLGFHNSAGLFASSFSIPNNLPAILIRRSKSWMPFFEGRSVTAELSKEIREFRPEADILQRLEDAGQTRLAGRYLDGQIGATWRDHLAMLALLPEEDEEVALAIGADLSTVRGIRSALRGLHLVDADGKLTSAGRSALEAHRRKRRRVTAMLSSDPSPYYPRYTR